MLYHPVCSAGRPARLQTLRGIDTRLWVINRPQSIYEFPSETNIRFLCHHDEHELQQVVQHEQTPASVWGVRSSVFSFRPSVLSPMYY